MVRCLVDDFVESKPATTLHLPPTDTDMRDLTAYVVKQLGFASETELNHSSEFNLASLRAFFIVSIVHKNIETGKRHVDSESSSDDDGDDDVHRKNDTYVRQYGVNPCWESGDTHDVRKRSRLVSSVVDFYIPKNAAAVAAQNQNQASGAESKSGASVNKNGASVTVVNAVNGGTSNGVNAPSKQHWTDIPQLRNMAQRCSIPISMPRSTLSAEYPAACEVSAAAVAAASAHTDNVLVTKSVSAAINAAPPRPPPGHGPHIHTSGPISARRVLYRYADVPLKKASVSVHGRLVDMTATSQGHHHANGHGHGNGHGEPRRGAAGLGVEGAAGHAGGVGGLGGLGGGERNVSSGGKHAGGPHDKDASSPKPLPSDLNDADLSWKSLFLYNVLHPAQKAAASLGVHPRMLDVQVRKRCMLRTEEEDTLEVLRRRLAAEEDPKKFSARVVKLNNNLDVIADDVARQHEETARRRHNMQVKAGIKTQIQTQFQTPTQFQTQLQAQFQTQTQAQAPRSLGVQKFKAVSGMLIRYKNSQSNSLDNSFSANTDSVVPSPTPRLQRSSSPEQHLSPKISSVVQLSINRGRDSREGTPPAGDTRDRSVSNVHAEKRGVIDSESSPRHGSVRVSQSHHVPNLSPSHPHQPHAPIAQRESGSLHTSDARVQTRQNAVGQTPREKSTATRNGVVLNVSHKEKGAHNSEGVAVPSARSLHVHTSGPAMHVLNTPTTVPDTRQHMPSARGGGHLTDRSNGSNFPRENDGIRSAGRALTERGKVRGNDDAAGGNSTRVRSARERDPHTTVAKDPLSVRTQTDRRRHAETDANGGRLRDSAGNPLSAVRHDEGKRDGQGGSAENGVISSELEALLRLKHLRNQGPAGRVWMCKLADTHGVFGDGKDVNEGDKVDQEQIAVQVCVWLSVCMYVCVCVCVCVYIYIYI
jgi:hypothetical protein